jgi:hypothetical protein
MKHMWTAVQGVDVSLTLVTGGKRTLTGLVEAEPWDWL